MLGGDTTDTVQTVAVDRKGAAIIGVQARSNNFPLTPQPFQKKRQGNRDAVLCMLDMLPDGVTRYGARLTQL